MKDGTRQKRQGRPVLTPGVFGFPSEVSRIMSCYDT